MTWTNVYFVCFFAALIISLIMTPACRQVAFFFNILDQPAVQNHKRHSKAIPLLGGMALCFSWLTTIAIGILISRTYLMAGHLDKSVISEIHGTSNVSKELISLCLGAVLITLFGLYDDVCNMKAKTKFAGQFVVAVIAATWGGAKVSIFLANPILSWAISVFWILVIMNAINFFDNMDGLAIGTGTIAFVFFAIIAAINGQHFVAVFGATMAGAAFGFWFYNCSPATIFMGDSGSHLLGYNLAILGCLVTYYNPSLSYTKIPILIPLFILAIPLYDLCAVVIIRWRNSKPFYIGDHNHLSHRFVKMGLSRPNAVKAVHLMVLAIGLSSLPLIWGDLKTTVICVIQATTILMLVSLLQNYVISAQNTDMLNDQIKTDDKTKNG